MLLDRFPKGEDAVDRELVREVAALYDSDRTADAIALLENDIAARPDRPETLCVLASLYERTHSLEKAAQRLDEAIRLAPDFAWAWILKARLARHSEDSASMLEALDIAQGLKLAVSERIELLYLRGRALEGLGRYAEAFDDFARAGRLDAVSRGVKPGYMDAGMVPKTIEIWLNSRVAADGLVFADAAGGEALPIFVSGFPRSGTTLVERILGSHPEIMPAGELNVTEFAVEALENALGGSYPEALDAHDAAHQRRSLTRAREAYIDAAWRKLGAAPSTRWFVDKTPFNSMHYVLLRLMFPESPFINVVRHPLDSVLSAYFENFYEVLEWSYSLPTAARLYLRLHEHLGLVTQLLPVKFRTIRYEELVGSMEPVVRDLLAFVDVPWEPACLEFHKSRRTVRTASYAQVTRPTYRSSLERYRHFIEFVDDATIETLAPVIAELGYSLDRHPEAAAAPANAMAER